MSTLPSTDPAAAPRKQPITVYTVMLGISALAMLIACILIYVELRRYGEFPWWNTRDAQPSVQVSAAEVDRLPAGAPRLLA